MRLRDRIGSVRRAAAICVSVVCLAGCQSGGPQPALVTPAPTPRPIVTLQRPETPPARKPNQMSLPKAKDLAAPVDAFVPGPGMDRASNQPVLATVSPSSRPETSYPQYRPSPSPLQAHSMAHSPPPGAIGHRVTPQEIAIQPRVASPQPQRPGPATAAGDPAPSPLPPRRQHPPAPPPHHALAPGAPGPPGQGAPPPFPTPLGERRATEKQLEQAYLQSRADALNLKYHGGRAVLGPHSPEVQFSAAAPPAIRPPAIPGSKMDVNAAFQASEAHRQQWQSYRNESQGGRGPISPALPNPGIPNPALPNPAISNPQLPPSPYHR
jgi:hypothetical protein